MEKTELVQVVEFIRDQEQKKCAEFAAKFAENPHHALDWSMGVFEAAAKLGVAEEILSSLEDAATKGELERERLAFLIENLEDEKHNHARWPRQSTSPTGNLSSICRMMACADMLDQLRPFQKKLAV